MLRKQPALPQFLSLAQPAGADRCGHTRRHVPACAWHHLRNSQRRGSHRAFKKYFPIAITGCFKFSSLHFFFGLSRGPDTAEGNTLHSYSPNGPSVPISPLNAHSIWNIPFMTSLCVVYWDYHSLTFQVVNSHFLLSPAPGDVSPRHRGSL